MMNRRRIAVMVIAVVILGSGMALAQDQPTDSVARISLINGDVSTQRGDSGEWMAASVNAPLVLGDSLATGSRSRAEVQLDYANVLRLGSNTDVKFADLTRSRAQIQVAQGLVDYAVVGSGGADAEIDTPNVAVHPLQEGTYRIQVDSPSQTEVIVRDGQAQVSTPQGNTTVQAGDLITIQGTDNPEYQITSAPARDDWDQWNRDRNRRILDARSWHYTNHYYTGADDLDDYGHWVNVPDYGWSWAPYVDAGWAPYRAGRWVWEPGWGWTWVSYEPWGWAPYHYGRWVYYDDDWCWWPGYVTPYYYPVWAPAYVSFFGFGFGHFGFGFGFGSIGWCPLGPADVFYPWWGVNSYNVVNITNVINITNIQNDRVISGAGFGLRGGRGFYPSNLRGALYNGNIRRGITTVSARDFATGRISRHIGTITAATLRQANVVKGTLPVVPTRRSLNPVSRIVRTPSVARSAGNTRFFTRRLPPVRPVSFTRQQTAIRQMVANHNPLLATNRKTAVATNPRIEAGAGASARAAAGGFSAQRPSPREPLRMGNRPGPATQPQRPGWQRFGARSSPSSLPRDQANRGGFRSQPAPQQRGASREGFQRFGSQSRPAPPERGQSYRPAPVQNARPGWTRFSQSGWGRANQSAPSGRKRPQLNLRKPIVVRRNPRSQYAGEGANRWGSNGGYNSRPTYRQWNRGDYNRGSYARSVEPNRGGWGGGNYSAPTYRGYSRGSDRGGGYSAPSNRGWSGGSYSHGGGYSRPSGGGWSRGYSGGDSGRGWSGGGRAPSYHASAPSRSSGRGRN